jgi:hypothetical protein
VRAQVPPVTPGRVAERRRRRLAWADELREHRATRIDIPGKAPRYHNTTKWRARTYATSVILLFCALYTFALVQVAVLIRDDPLGRVFRPPPAGAVVPNAPTPPSG